MEKKDNYKVNVVVYEPDGEIKNRIRLLNVPFDVLHKLLPIIFQSGYDVFVHSVEED